MEHLLIFDIFDYCVSVGFAVKKGMKISNRKLEMANN